MIDKNNLPRFDNIKGLVQDLTEVLDQRMDHLRQGTVLENIRPSDAKTFMLAARKPRTVSDLAKAMDVSRQAVHTSVGRLVALKVVHLEPAPGSHRDKIVCITKTGDDARRIAAQNLSVLESELIAKIGHSRFEAFREVLIDLLRVQD